MKVKTIIIGYLTLLMTFLMGTSYAMIDYEDISTAAGVTVVNKYIWRGFNLSDGANIQPDFSVGLAGVTLGYWGSYHWENDDTNNEHDLYIGYDWAMMDDLLNFSVGYTYYKFGLAGDKTDDTHEFWIGVSVNTLLNPSITAYIDVEERKDGGGDGEYFLASISHDIELAEGLTLGLGLGLGYNNDFFIDENGFADITPSVSVSWSVNDHISVAVSATYSRILDSDVEKAMIAAAPKTDEDELIVGIQFSVS